MCADFNKFLQDLFALILVKKLTAFENLYFGPRKVERNHFDRLVSCECVTLHPSPKNSSGFSVK